MYVSRICIGRPFLVNNYVPCTKISLFLVHDEVKTYVRARRTGIVQIEKANNVLRKCHCHPTILVATKIVFVCIM